MATDYRGLPQATDIICQCGSVFNTCKCIMRQPHCVNKPHVCWSGAFNNQQRNGFVARFAKHVLNAYTIDSRNILKGIFATRWVFHNIVKLCWQSYKHTKWRRPTLRLRKLAIAVDFKWAYSIICRRTIANTSAKYETLSFQRLIYTLYTITQELFFDVRINYIKQKCLQWAYHKPFYCALHCERKLS